MHKETEITVPLKQYHYWLYNICAVGFAILALRLLGFTLMVLQDDRLKIADYAGIFVLFVCAFLLFRTGWCMFMNNYRSLKITPDTIQLFRWKTNNVLLDTQEVRLFATVQWLYNARVYSCIVLCRYSQEELTQLREQQLQKGVFTRGELPFRKRVAQWQVQFAKEYIARQRFFWQVRSPRKKDIIWIPRETETEILLRQNYPHIPWLQIDNLTFDAYPQPRDQLTVTAEDITVTNQNHARTVLAENVQAIYVCGNQSEVWRFSTVQYIAVLQIPVAELAERELERLNSTPVGKQKAQAYLTIENWQQLLAMRYCRKVVGKGEKEIPFGILIQYSKEREQLLRQFYSQIPWFVDKSF